MMLIQRKPNNISKTKNKMKKRENQEDSHLDNNLFDMRISWNYEN